MSFSLESLRPETLVATARRNFPGVFACVVAGVAATFVAAQYGAPVMLMALLIGIGLNFLSQDGACAAGVAFSSRTLLRLGVALLGLRISVGQVMDLGWAPIAMVIIALVVTIGLSMVAAKAMGFRSSFGLLSGGATAICGASAAMALSATLPPSPQRDRATSFTIIGVSTLSTVAMILYPLIARAFGLDERLAGIFLGGSIHDVAQVVGAGYSMSKSTGDIATVVKLTRVAMLLPVILFAVWFSRERFAGVAGASKPPLLPGFAVGFVVLVLLGSTGWIPQAVVRAGTTLSQWCLVSAIVAIGMKTQLQELKSVGIKPVLLMIGETVFLGALVLALTIWL